ncbi:hypothetical protein GCM10011609_83030 [Lentzea pudingi]|uniref:Uncharacterized protein n=1 Tax=Lentzea pudingi TaxID=1789439 RepID=A0ABQ2IQV4_9PSEU|nr:hypothetical protein [Lentzea pudingi]GGN27582.1 hypothetical protein GCM10011609_83030 [Lentzea pudingi]
MAMIGEVDPRVQALFDDNLAKTRRSTAEVSVELRANQDKVAADIEAREAKQKRDQAEARESAENITKQGEKQQQRKPQWDRPDRGTGEMAFGPEDDDGGYAPRQQAPVAAPVPPPPPPPVAPPPPVHRRRPAPVDDDDDLSGQTWLS